MKNIRFIVGVIFVITCVVLVVMTISRRPKNGDDTMTVVTTLFPLYDFTKNIGGEKVKVALLLPPGVEAHSFEPTPSDIIAINESDLFVYTGEFMEPWAEDVIEGIDKRVRVVDASEGVTLMKEEAEDEHEHEEDEHEEADDHESEETHHHHGGVDPHIWLDFENDGIILDTLTTALAEKDPANADFYTQNATDYKNALAQMDAKYTAGLSSCKSREVVYGGHYAFGYLAKRYTLHYRAAQGIAPDSEPTAQDLVALVEQVKKNNIRYIFYEELTTPKIAETLANETQAQTLLLNGAHNISKDDFENNISFLSIMENNLATLKIGLQCGE